MSECNATSSGHILEFNRATGTGTIRDEATKRILAVQFSSFKRRSKRYLSNDNAFIGELFDFDTVVKQKSNGADDNDILEAVHVRHRVLKCTVDGCPRIKAFTNVKALEDHTHTRHASRKIKEKIYPTAPIKAKAPRKKRRALRKPELITLSDFTTAATVGLFIGKQGLNIKRIQTRNHVKLQLIETRKTHSTLQVLIRPNVGVTIDMALVVKNLKFEWERCVREQQAHVTANKARSTSEHPSSEYVFLEFEGDTRYRPTLTHRHVIRFKQQALLSKGGWRQTNSSVRVQERHSYLRREGNRSIATCDRELRQKSVSNQFSSSRMRNGNKEKQWLVKEQLRDL